MEASEKSLKVLLNEYQHNFIIQSNETNGSHHTPQLRCEENENDNEYYNENDEVHVEMEDDVKSIKISNFNGNYRFL